MNTDPVPFRRTLLGVTAVHGAFILFLLVVATWQGCAIRRRPVEIPIEFMVETESRPAPNAAREPPPPPPAAPDDIALPTRRPDPPPRRPIEVSRQRVVRQTTTEKPPERPRLSEAEIRRLLELGATPGDRTVVPEGDALHLEVIRRRMYAAWVQPGGVPPGTTLEAAIDLAAGGAVTARRLLRRSGHAAMDDSVTRALDAVSSIPGLPASFIARHRTVTITFELARETASP